jgi:hypothetical protein
LRIVLNNFPVFRIRIQWIRTLINWPPGSGSRP